MNTSEPPLVRVVLFQIRTPAEKLARLTSAAASHFEKKERLIILAEDEKAALFVDELLWKSPPSSFLPHAAAEEATDELIAINRSKKNINQAHYAFNLCPTPLLIEGPFKMIYDFEDSTSPSKKQFSRIRFDAYKKAGYLIEARYTATV